MNRIMEKIAQIDGFIGQIKEIAPSDIEEYKTNMEKKAACERYVEKIVGAAIDLAFIVIKTKKFEMPEDDADAFTILSKHGVINEKLALRLKDAKGMRNVIAHEYGRINDDIVFHSITEELSRDMREFMDKVKS